MNSKKWLKMASAEAQKGAARGDGGPFGAVIIKDEQVIARAHNEVIKRNDPTAHAEILAIRKAAKKLGSFDLSGCTLYASCEPCPMCLGAVLWSRVSALVYGCTRQDAARIGFDDSAFYDHVLNHKPVRWLSIRRVESEQCLTAMSRWAENPERKLY